MRVEIDQIESFETYLKMVEKAEEGLESKIGTDLKEKSFMPTTPLIKTAILVAAIVAIVAAYIFLTPSIISMAGAISPYASSEAVFALGLAVDAAVMIPLACISLLGLEVYNTLKAEHLFNLANPLTRNWIENELDGKRFSEKRAFFANNHINTHEIIRFGLLGDKVSTHEYAAFTALVPIRDKAACLLCGAGDTVWNETEFSGMSVLDQLDDYFERACEESTKLV